VQHTQHNNTDLFSINHIMLCYHCIVQAASSAASPANENALEPVPTTPTGPRAALGGRLAKPTIATKKTNAWSTARSKPLRVKQQGTVFDVCQL
jgi:hypothetical protein